MRTHGQEDLLPTILSFYLSISLSVSLYVCLISVIDIMHIIFRRMKHIHPCIPYHMFLHKRICMYLHKRYRIVLPLHVVHTQVYRILGVL